jgi:hypothetical protein
MFFYILLVIMASRLYSLFRDESLSVSGLFLIMGIQLLFLLVFSIKLTLILLVISLFAIDIIQFAAEKKAVYINIYRFISFLFLSITALIFGSGAVDLSVNANLVAGIQNLIMNFNPFAGLNISGLQVIIILTGLFFLLNESNFLIRLVFELSGKVPVTKDTRELDKKELNAGRIIGILERIIIFFFIIIGQYAAVGFVIAAKGVVRYKELENRNFAEYFLIGTLLSSLLSMFTGMITASLMN